MSDQKIEPNPEEPIVFKKDVNRRDFLKVSGATAGATALLSGNNSILHNLQELSKENNDKNTEEKLVPVVCRPNCQQSCRLFAHVVDGKVVKTSMAPMADPTYNRICLRGLSHVQRIYGSERIKYPMKRVGERGEGKWERISWDESITTIAENFKRIQDQYGQQALSFFTASGNFGSVTRAAVTRLMNVLGASSINQSCDMAVAYGLMRTIGSFYLDGNEPKDMGNARTIIAWGSNITDSQVQTWHFIPDALEKGAKFIVIDPRFSTTASKADIFVQVRPGSDTALVLGMINVILEEGLEDIEFISKSTVAPFLVRDDTQSFLRRSHLTGKEVAQGEVDPVIIWDTETGAGLPLEEATSPALEGKFTVGNINVTTAYSLLKELVNQYPPEEVAKLTDVNPDLIREIARLYATNVPSTVYLGYGPDRYSNGHLHSHAVATMASLTGNLGKPGASVGLFVNGEFLAGKNPQDNIAYTQPEGKVQSPSVTVLTLFDVIDSGQFLGQPYPLKALYVAIANPLSNSTDQKTWIEKVLPNFEFIVVTDIAMTDTARYADILLPIDHWFEHEDVCSFGHLPILNHSAKAIEPLFEAKTDSDICRLLGNAMGVGEYFQDSDEEILHQLLDNNIAKAVNINLERIREESSIRWMPDPFIYGEGGHFPTASGRVEFYVDNVFPLGYWGQELNVNAERLPYWRPPTEAWPENPLFKKYPLVYIQEHPKWRVHGQWHEIPWLRELDPEPIIYVNPGDANERGVKGGDYVEVFNGRGQVVLKAVLSEGIRPGLVSIPKGWQRNQFIQGGYNELTTPQDNVFAVNVSSYDTLVDFRKFEG